MCVWKEALWEGHQHNIQSGTRRLVNCCSDCDVIERGSIATGRQIKGPTKPRYQPKEGMMDCRTTQERCRLPTVPAPHQRTRAGKKTQDGWYPSDDSKYARS